jgi:hypothetical protein
MNSELKCVRVSCFSIIFLSPFKPETHLAMGLAIRPTKQALGLFATARQWSTDSPTPTPVDGCNPNSSG